MIKHKTDWWYARVGASPRPEAGELVNIGLILGNGGAQDVEVAPDLPRLKGLVTPSERHLYEEIIAALREKVWKGADLYTLRQIYGPQIRISEPRELFTKPDKKLRRALRRKLLETPEESKKEAVGPRGEAEEKVRRVIGRVVQLGYEVKARPNPRKLYQDQWKKVFTSKVPSLAFALRSKAEREDVLVDGVVIHEEDPDYPVRTGQVSRIGRAFWEYRRAERKILEIVGRRVRMVGMIFNGHSRNGHSLELPDVRNAREFIHHVWQQDLDLFVEASSEEHVDQFRQALASGRWGRGPHA